MRTAVCGTRLVHEGPSGLSANCVRCSLEPWEHDGLMTCHARKAASSCPQQPAALLEN